jgi:predicted porin
VVRDQQQETGSKMAAQAVKLIRTEKEKLMNRKLMVAAVAAAFVAPAAFAQTSVTIGGTINILWDNVRASGATNTGTIPATNPNGGATAAGGQPLNNDVKSHDRVRDGAGSNIRFTVIEDLGGGNSAFVQVESAVVVNSDQRTDAMGNGGGLTGPQPGLGVWGNRNTGVGIRSKTAGRFLIGVWDVHYHETYTVDPGWIPMNSAQSILGLMNTFGMAIAISGSTAGAAGQNPAIGGRYSNVLRWDSPNWSGFSIAVNYARPTDGVPPSAPGSITDGKKNRVWNFAPKYESGGLALQYSYLRDKDIVIRTSTASASGFSGVSGLPGTGVLANPLTFGSVPALPSATTAGAVTNGGPQPLFIDSASAGNVATNSLIKITSNRLGGRYKFANGFGLGAMWDSSKFNMESESGATPNQLAGIGACTGPGQSLPAANTTTMACTNGRNPGTNIKRTVWAFPLTYDFGNHHLVGTYARARDWKGSIVGVDLGTANITQQGTTYNLGSATGAKLWSFGYSYNLSQRTNVHLSYAQIKNEALARYDFFANSSGLPLGSHGADPRTYAIGLRHTF